jgi:hypothetical protein
MLVYEELRCKHCDSTKILRLCRADVTYAVTLARDGKGLYFDILEADDISDEVFLCDGCGKESEEISDIVEM